METCTRARRLRYAAPQPTGRQIAISADDLRMFKAINRHGPLPTTYLHAFTAHKNYNAFQYRLTKLYNGSQQTPPLLTRPAQQFQSFYARQQPLVYDLTKSAKGILEDGGESLVARTDPFLHRLMGACAGASIELESQSCRIRYISQNEILDKCTGKLRIAIRGKTIVPDSLFGLQYPNSTYRFFAVEVDRNTEGIEGQPRCSNTFDRKLKTYLDLMVTQEHQKQWGVPTLMVLTITSNDGHRRNLVRHLDRLVQTSLKNRFLFKSKSDFGAIWRVPPIMSDLLKEPWQRAGSDFNIGAY